MPSFLLYIGLSNVLGSLLLMCMNAEKMGDTLLRKYTEIINEPYSHGPFGKMWLWWAASTNLFLGLTMILSVRWEASAQKEVILLVLLTYVIMYLVMLIGAKKPKYGRGIYVTHFLWLAQIGWGAWLILS